MKADVYIVSCHNEWCSGPQHFATIADPPEIGIRCPVCGWLARIGSGIEPVNNTPLEEIDDIEEVSNEQ
jgi:hypothetical protein